jgi:hypothetical protein
VAKTYDIDGDNILGTAGHYLAKTTFGPGGNEDYSASNFDTSVMTFSVAPWLSVSAADAQVNNQLNYGYRQFQDPSAPAGKLNVGYMGRRFSSTLTTGDSYSLYDFTVSAGVPGTFTITVATHPEIGAINIASAFILTLLSGSGSDTQFVAIPADAYTDFNAAFTTFTITGAQPGDVFQLLGQAAGPDNLLINGLMIDSIATPALSAIESWRVVHFGSPENTGQAADFADYDADGIVNLVEYALNSLPTSATSAASPNLPLQSGTGHLQLNFQRIADPTLVYEVQATSNLAAWPDTPIWSSTGAENTLGLVAVTDSVAPGSTRFLRLQVTLP